MNDWRYHNPIFEFEEKLKGVAHPWSGHKYFAYDLVANIRPKKIVELGTHYGVSLWSFCQAVKDQNIETEINAIDTWKGEKHSGFYGEEVFGKVNDIKRGFYPGLKINLVRKTFDEAVSDFKDNSIDVLHIDGLHTYEAVKHDFETWLPKVNKNGIVLFHDIKVGEDDFGVYKLWEELKKRYITIDFFQSYGLGVLFLEKNLGKEMKNKEQEWQMHYSYIHEMKKAEAISSQDPRIKKNERLITQRHVKVTIVVPVYKDIPTLRKCILSLKDNVDARHKIMLMNDHGPEAEQIESEIANLIKGDARFEYHANKSNLGFVKTCNKAVYEIDKTDNEILLLNSDTVITADFLEELIEVLYLNEKHGIACPRSNNASVLTIPFNYQGDRSLVTEKSYDCYKKIKELLPKYSVIPTAVGFCMLVRRSLISNYGLFDEVYSPGYDEENDFSMRINRYGYSVVVSNYAYVFHWETKSFSQEQKIRLNKQNEGMLLKRYPYYREVVSKYIDYQMNPIEYFAEFIDDSFYEKKKILFSLLDLQAVCNGTSEYALNLLKEFVKNFSHKYDIDILTNPQADEYHKLSKTYPNIYYQSSITKHYHLAVLPSQFFDLNHLLLLNRLSLKIIFSMLDIIAVRCNYLSSQSPFLENLFALSLMYTDGVISISEYTKKDTLSYFDQVLVGEYGSKMKVIHLGSDKTMFDPKNRKSGIPFKKYILIVGNQHFDHKSVKEAVEELKKTEYNFCVLGSDDYIQNDKYIGYPSGKLSDEFVEELYYRSESAVFPSTYEGFGLPILKALKYNKKIVLLDNEVNREISKIYPANSFIFYKQNKDIGDAIRNSASVKAQKADVSRTWEDVAIETEAFIGEILSKGTDTERLHKRWSSLMTLEQKIKDTGIKDLMVSKSRKIYKVLDLMSRNKVIANVYRTIKKFLK